MFCFFQNFYLAIISLPIFEVPINLRSNEIVTQGALSAERCAAVPAPASTKADRYPPCVIPAAFK